MTIKIKNCEECNKEFEYEPNPNYPDKRKYCHKCSELKKATWNAKNAEKDDEKNVSPHTEGYGTTETTEFGAPVEKVPTTMTKLVPEKQAKEFHLSPEQVRTNAFDLALRFDDSNNKVRTWELVKEIEEYLWNGK